MAYKINPIPADTGGYGLQRMPQKAVVIEEPVVNTGTVAAGSAADGYTSYINALMQQQAELKAQRDAQVAAAYDNAKANLDSTRKASLKDSYVSYMKGLKNMPQISAVSGNGGYAQSLLAKQQLGYENNRTAIKQDYMNNLRELEANKAAGIISNQADYLDGAQSYMSQLANMQKNYSAPAAAAPAVTGEYKYKIGSQTLTREQLLDYLASIGMTTEQARAYMERNQLNP